MVNRSEAGDLRWTHNGELVRSQDSPHYTISPTGTELDIFDASAEQAGSYEAILVNGPCQVRNVIEVQIKGNFQVWAVNPDESVCVGDTASFEAYITGDGDKNDFILEWLDPNNRLITNSDRYTLNVNRTVLTIYNTLPSDAGDYKVQIRDVTDDSNVRYSSFHLEVQVSDIYLHTLVKSPVKIKLGGRGTLMVNRSEAGDLRWTHNVELVQSQDSPHYTISPTGTELNIFDASAEQAGFYEAILVNGSCRVHDFIEVQVVVSFVLKCTWARLAT
ncbi:hypothetical protein ACROYT_G006515 [Oculina patagonica]